MASRSQRLPLARASSGSLSMPDAKAIEKLFSVSTTEEAALYFYQQLDKQANALGVSGAFKEVLEEVNQFVELVKKQSSTSSNYWSGDVVDRALTQFMTFQQRLSKEATESLGQNLAGKVLIFDFAMSPDSQLVQGFAIEGVDLDDATNSQINHIFSNWLTQHQMICKDGVIYEIEENGRIKEDNQKAPILVDSDEYVKLFQDSKNGFAAFVEKETDAQLSVKVTQREYPSQPVASH